MEKVRWFKQTMVHENLWKIVETHSNGVRVRKFFKRMEVTEWTGGDDHRDVWEWKLQGEEAEGWKLKEKKGRKRARIIEEQAIKVASVAAMEQNASPELSAAQRSSLTGHLKNMKKVHGRKYKSKSVPPKYSYEMKEITEAEATAILLMEEL